MKRVCLVACVSSKASVRTKAKDMYRSPLYKKCYSFVTGHFDKWYILSAKYGLLEPERIIEPYEETLNSMPSQSRREWTQKVLEQVFQKTDSQDEITFLAGKRYREGLVSQLRKRGNKVNVPMERMPIGKQLQWLSRIENQSEALADLNRFYELLSKLSADLDGWRLLGDCDGHMAWPERGVYFLFEPNEFRRLDNTKQRVVRVGTHMVSKGSKASLWNRLSTHRGTTNGGGNHRSSILRLHIGTAIMAKHGDIAVATWGKGQSADQAVREKEAELEHMVSTYIGKMRVVWLAVGDEASPLSDRAYMERNSIGLLAGQEGPIDPPSPSWLGNYAPNASIRNSGLWNVRHVDYDYDPQFIDVLDKYVKVTLGVSLSPQQSIAPDDWYFADKKGLDRRQKSLFKEL